MAFTLKKRNKIKVHVKGQLKDEDGSPVDFDFHLHMQRKTQEEINDLASGKGGKTIREFLVENTDGWDDVHDEGGAPIEFSAEAFDNILKGEPGLGMVCYQSFLRDSGAVVKN